MSYDKDIGMMIPDVIDGLHRCAYGFYLTVVRGKAFPHGLEIIDVIIEDQDFGSGRAFCFFGKDLLDTRKELDRKSTRLNSSHPTTSRMPSSA